MHSNYVRRKYFQWLFILLLLISLGSVSELSGQPALRKKHFAVIPADGNYNPAKPWVLWYWMDASVSEGGIRADLIAMKEQGIAGAYLVCIRGKTDSLLIDPPVVQLTPLWWAKIKKTFQIADSLGFKLGMHVGDGFATSGGPWITPELSMQRVVWADTTIEGGSTQTLVLPRPKNIRENYYEDIAVYAFPALSGGDSSTDNIRPEVRTNAEGQDAGKLVVPGNTENFSYRKPCWIEYRFKEPFTCRTVDITTKGVTFQAKRLSIWISDDGQNYRFFTRLKPARSGWQDYTYPVHYTIPAVRSRYFRFVYDPAGTEPGSEDLDDAKWSPSLKLTGLRLGSRSQIPHFEGKSGAVWRISERADSVLIPDNDCIARPRLLNITDALQPDGRLRWKVPAGQWTILRMGHSSTGMKNATAGGGQGLECDKLNPVAVQLQFDNWFGKVIQRLGPDLSSRVLKVFYMDSWECGSQNWSPVFRKAFKEKRGYDPLDYLPVMAGYPVGSARKSEDFLHDIRLTIADLLNENYFTTLADLAHAKGYKVAAECTAPIMVADGIRHFDQVDFPMGEFWLRSPTHDKPNDILDAISGGHIYGKRIIQAEAFTELRNKWDEYPAMLKTLQDHHYALGVNRLVFHVFGENPWLNREPGMTLGGVGLYFQRNQTWWPMAHGWMDYTRRCQALLQQGAPVTDIAVFNGEELPSRAVLPDRLVSTLPGIFGDKRLSQERKRLANKGNPMQHIPEKVTSSAGITTAKDWVDPLHGYKYDAINRDALLRLATVRSGRIVLPGGASYGILVLPRLDKMDPNHQYMSVAVARKLLQLVKAGARLLVDRYPRFPQGQAEGIYSGDTLRALIKELMGTRRFFDDHSSSGYVRKVGEGEVLYGPYTRKDFDEIGIERDFQATGDNGMPLKGIAWNHRQLDHIDKVTLKSNSDVPNLDSVGATDLYFVANQTDTARRFQITLREGARVPLLYDPVQARYLPVSRWRTGKETTTVGLQLPANGSVFVLLKKNKTVPSGATGKMVEEVNESRQTLELPGPWKVQFDPGRGGPALPVLFDHFTDWTQNALDSIRHYSGVATYLLDFNWKGAAGGGSLSHKIGFLALGKVNNIASIRLNGIDCGVAWTAPYQVDITKALKVGKNHLEIKVANTWSNRIIADQKLPASKRQTWTTAPFNLEKRGPLPAGLLGPVRLMMADVGVKNK